MAVPSRKGDDEPPSDIKLYLAVSCLRFSGKLGAACRCCRPVPPLDASRCTGRRCLDQDYGRAPPLPCSGQYKGLAHVVLSGCTVSDRQECLRVARLLMSAIAGCCPEGYLVPGAILIDV